MTMRPKIFHVMHVNVRNMRNAAIENVHCGCERNSCKDWVGQRWGESMVKYDQRQSDVSHVILRLSIIMWIWERVETHIWHLHFSTLFPIVSYSYCLSLLCIGSLELYAHSTKKSIKSEAYNECLTFVRKVDKQTTIQTISWLCRFVHPMHVREYETILTNSVTKKFPPKNTTSH